MLYTDIVLQQMEPFVDIMPEKIDSFSSSDIAIFKPEAMFKGPARFDCYEFIFCLGHIPDIYIEKIQYSIGRSGIGCINPMQSHGTVVEQPVSCYIPVFIDKAVFNENSYAIAGKTNISFSNDPYTYESHLLSLVYSFMRESKLKQLGYDFVLKSITSQLVAYLIRDIPNSIIQCNSQYKYKDSKNINKVIEFLWENYNKEFTYEEIAKTINYSPYHFIRIFKDVTGKTPHEYLIDIKIQKAISQLKFTENNITEICYGCGFNNLNHFSTVFKRRTGVSPRDFRKSL